jgi:hypothetical protein
MFHVHPRLRVGLLLAVGSLLGSAVVAEDTENPAAIRFSDREKVRWRMGIKIEARGNTTNILATFAVPNDWPEQKVELYEQDISAQVRKPTFRELDGVKQAVISIPKLAAGEEAHAIFTYDITRRDIDPPEDAAGLSLPKKAAATAKYLGISPFIETNDPLLKQAAADAVGAEVTDQWQRAEAIYDHVREKVKYKFDEKIKSAVAAWKDGEGDCEELTSLFIALCRNNNIPARAVWVPGHCYPEFYLADAKGEGHWYPCQAAGDHSFGRMHEPRPILQKGDNFKLPESPKPLRYVQPFVKAGNAAADPVVKFVLEKVEEK